MSKNYEVTGYPYLFENTYWGSFVVKANPEMQDEIIKNRNTFVEKYAIVDKPKREPYYATENFSELGSWKVDHPETYMTKDGTYFNIISLYNENPDNKSAIRSGWTMIEKLYHSRANTYIKEAKKKEFTACPRISKRFGKTYGKSKGPGDKKYPNCAHYSCWCYDCSRHYVDHDTVRELTNEEAGKLEEDAKDHGRYMRSKHIDIVARREEKIIENRE
ncbi:MAG: hypothetical protein Hyperionvirus4_18 [Hyperionvirus sp.]|uniref:Uncharacterized protein n=1 Tax=Hyperionvirus sp. TaxID=2487770 RepID=A0A3G5AB41_9VIRU|nr:MAG: hypothetical protein Hyperionvirus4_18 [Hyperionvirus sp.]